MTAIVVMQVPFGNPLPALALVFRDGVAVILGLLISGVALVATTGPLLMAGVWSSEWILVWVWV